MKERNKEMKEKKEKYTAPDVGLTVVMLERVIADSNKDVSTTPGDGAHIDAPEEGGTINGDMEWE
ncbi:MAG: hypothetical protein LBN24_00670 [Mediterranea sp.]|jgi:hypothetical protein|nr:hypothetical protein [Mediterranea sp.]